MADKKSESKDPTMKSGASEASDFPEGTHPVRSPADVTHSVARYVYKDNPDKPDPSTVAQVVDVKE